MKKASAVTAVLVTIIFSINYSCNNYGSKAGNTVAEGEKLALFNSAGYLEIAINKGNAAGLFEHAAARPTLSERFPKLTVVAIAVALVAFTVATEIEYLRGAGYYWR